MTSTRPYHSELRQQQALETRRRIRQAARQLFEEHGFTDTTIARIAAAAGVSPQTIYSVFESKAGIVLAMLDDLEETANEDEWAQRFMTDPDPREQLRLFAAFNRHLFENGAPILRAMLAASGTTEVAAAVTLGNARRRAGTRRLASVLAERGALRDGIAPDDAADRLWLLTAPEQFFNAVDELGWTPAHYEAWLGDLLVTELLGPA